MTTIPARLARTTQTSRSLEAARAAARTLYRDWYRGAPEIVTLFALALPHTEVRTVIRREFEKNRHVTDPKVLDMLVLKGRQDFQETMNTWKQYPHIMDLLKPERVRPQKSFMQKFLEGRDEEAIIPASQ